MASDVLADPSSSYSYSSSSYLTAEAVWQQGGEYDYNKDYGSVIHMWVSLHLLEATVNIDLGDRDYNNDNRHNHHHHINRVSIVGHAAASSNASTHPRRWPRRKRGRIRPGTRGCQEDDKNVGIGIGIGKK